MASTQWRFATAALLSGLVGLWLTSHYPILPWVTSAAFVAGSLLCFAYPAAWLVFVPALLPVLGLAPWTGWITFEELDLLLLAAAVGGYGRLAFAGPHVVPAGSAGTERVRDAGALAKLIVTLFAVSVLVSMVRGFLDAGGFDFGWYQGYHEPMNSLRLAKPFFLALLLWPLWQVAGTNSPHVRAARLSLGLMLGLAGIALAAVWERLAYTGLLDFSTDYRTTALFWEMHVGGAAIDGALVLMLPFAAREVLVARQGSRWAAGVLATLLGGYACLSTFSRSVYMAVPLGLGLLVWLQVSQWRRLAKHLGGSTNGSVWPALLQVAGFAFAAIWVFPTSGYRGLLTLLGAFAVMLPLAEPVRRFGSAEWLVGLGSGVILSGLAAACTVAWPRGAYAAYALAAVLTVAMLAALHVRPRLDRKLPGADTIAPLALGGFVAMLSGMALVSFHWGGGPGLTHALPASALLMAALAVLGRRTSPSGPPSLRWQGSVLGAMVMIASVIGVFAGGSYMTERIAGDSKNLGGRLHNWRLGLAMLDTPLDWTFGKGLGRFPANYALAATGTNWRPGDYRLIGDAAGRHLVLSAATHPLGWLEILRFSQRTSPVQTPASVRFRVRTGEPANLLFEVCEKHLLYSATCLTKSARVPPVPGHWQAFQVQLEGKPPTRGDGYAPKLIVFSVGLETQGVRAELDDLELSGPDGVNLLRNGAFDEDLAHWFFSSDGYHTPWHVEGILMNALLDQGMVGAWLLLSLLAGALWRTTLGNGRNHSLAPALAAALLGFAVVGLFSSVIDVPRVAFLFYLLLLLGLSLRGAASRRD